MCERYPTDENSTRSGITVCPKGIKFCYTSAYVIREGNSYRLKVLKQGCWSKSKAGEGGCTFGSCLIGKSAGKNAANLPRTCCCRGFVRGMACNQNTTYLNRILHKKVVAPPIVLAATSKTPGKECINSHDINKVSQGKQIIIWVLGDVPPGKVSIFTILV